VVEEVDRIPRHPAGHGRRRWEFVFHWDRHEGVVAGRD
jgi:hypothetical protein